LYLGISGKNVFLNKFGLNKKKLKVLIKIIFGISGALKPYPCLERIYQSEMAFFKF